MPALFEDKKFKLCLERLFLSSFRAGLVLRNDSVAGWQLRMFLLRIQREDIFSRDGIVCSTDKSLEIRLEDTVFHSAPHLQRRLYHSATGSTNEKRQ